MNVKIDYSDNIAVLTIDRPQKLNALNYEVLRDLDAAIDEIEKNSDLRAVVVTGSGEKSFVAGADIAAMRDMGPKEAEEFGRFGSEVFLRFEKLTIPVIAAINGYALGGGCELALACDIRIAGENAVFGLPEVTLGIIPGGGGTQRLPRLVGRGIAMELIMSARRIDAAEAYRIGLVNKVVPKESVVDEAIALAKTIAKYSKTAIASAKYAVVNGLETDLEKGLKIENKVFHKCFATQEQKDAMSAFLQKK